MSDKDNNFTPIYDMDFTPIYDRERSTELCSIWEDIERMAEKWENSWGCTRKEVIDAVIFSLIGLTDRRYNERLSQHPKDQRKHMEYIIQYTQWHLDKMLSKAELEYVGEKFGDDLIYLRDANNFGFEPDDSW